MISKLWVNYWISFTPGKPMASLFGTKGVVRVMIGPVGSTGLEEVTEDVVDVSAEAVVVTVGGLVLALTLGVAAGGSGCKAGADETAAGLGAMLPVAIVSE